VFSEFGGNESEGGDEDLDEEKLLSSLNAINTDIHNNLW
jgi:hypothetical protein